METIGDRIKSKRKEAGMTQLELASKLNVTDRAVSKWEQNEGNPDISILPRIADLFNVTLDYLMTGVEPKKEVIIMSKIELCAKNDDSSMIKSLPSNVDENGKLCGDVDFADLEGTASAATPVPGGVGSVTTTMVIENIIAAGEKLAK